MRITFFSSLFFALVFLSLTPVAYAANPVITSFGANPSSVANAYQVTFSWTQDSGTGGRISFANCPTGLSIKNAGGTDVCGSYLSESVANGSDYVTVYNVSGSTKSFTAMYTPSDSAGAQVTDVTAQASVSVTPVPVPISDFAASVSSLASGGTQTFTWTGVYIPGTNLQFDCNPDITITSGSDTLPCGTPAFSSDLAMSGSQTVVFTSKSRSDTTVTARILPAMAAGAYDAIHSIATTFVVAPPAAAAAPLVPSVVSASVSASTVVSGGTIDLSWVTSGSSGANVLFNCDTSIVPASIVAGATTTLICGSVAFTPALGISGTTTLMFTNTRYAAQPLTITVFPQDSNGNYLGQYSKALSLVVLAQGASLSPIVPAALTTAAQTNSTSGVTPHSPLTRALYKGLKHSQVAVLQQFLARDASLYPLGMISGYFGSATEAAVKAFQVKYGLAKEGDAAYGFVGPSTRAKINALVTP